ncbi:MAG TPA: response regulator [Bryobacteraceae bacterium]|nr:response regulator [Bryobacteraceae bacterium]
MPESQIILVVDDEPQVIKAFTRVLAKAGYTILSAHSGTAGMRILRKTPVDLVILDLSMPEPDGFEVLAMIRNEQPELKVLVASGFIGGSLLRAARLLGASATMQKTEAPKNLLPVVQRLVGAAIRPHRLTRVRPADAGHAQSSSAQPSTE